MSEEEDTITFRYVFSEDYSPVYVNGAHGGPTPMGDVVIHFYLDRLALPRSFAHRLNPDGSLGEQVSAEPPGHERTMVRFVPTGVILHIDAAKVLHQWLGEQVKAAEAVIEARRKAVADKNEKEE